jgi:hypothetical protein
MRAAYIAAWRWHWLDRYVLFAVHTFHPASCRSPKETEVANRELSWPSARSYAFSIISAVTVARSPSTDSAR